MDAIPIGRTRPENDRRKKGHRMSEHEPPPLIPRKPPALTRVCWSCRHPVVAHRTRFRSRVYRCTDGACPCLFTPIQAEHGKPRGVE